MGLISVSSINNGDALDATVVTNNTSTIVNEFNGNIDNNNIKSSAGIATSKLAIESWANWTPSYTGFSANPTLITRWYSIGGKTAFVTIAETSSGTSNATTFTITLPFTPKSTQFIGGFRIKDNGGYSTTQGGIGLTAGSTTASIFRDATGTAFTTSNAKACDGSFVCEIQ